MHQSQIERLKARLGQVRRRQDKARAEALKAAEIGDTEAEAFYDKEARKANAEIRTSSPNTKVGPASTCPTPPRHSPKREHSVRALWHRQCNDSKSPLAKP